jgi:hypothetical protein
MPKIGRYRIEYNSSSNQSWTAEIRCYNDADTTLVGCIRFYKQGVPIPADSSTGITLPILNYELSRFNDVVTLLRSEDYVDFGKGSYDSIGASVAGFALFTGGEFTGDLEVN